MADVAALTGDPTTCKALDHLWETSSAARSTSPAASAPRGENEAFGAAYDLPNLTAYSETCAAVANVFLNQRMFLLHGDARYVDVLERTLYNALLAGVSFSGDRFFYDNPARLLPRHERSPWFDCSCCPGNISPFPPLASRVRVRHNRRLPMYVNLFINGKATVDVAGKPGQGPRQETRYPWDGRVKIILEPRTPKTWTLRLRVPGWTLGRPVPSDLYRYLETAMVPVTLKVNGMSIPLEMDKGYARVRRSWRAGDRIEMNLPMPVRRVIANEAVAADRGKIALERGPIVYCAEGADKSGRARNTVIADDAALESEFRPDLLGGVTVIRGKVFASGTQTALLAVPYSVWAHRGAGEMAVWLPRTPPVAPGRKPIQ